MRKVRLRNYVAGWWKLTIRTDEQDNFLREKVKWVLRDFQDIQKEPLHTDSVASRRPGFRMSCQMTVSKGWDLFHIDLKTDFSKDNLMMWIVMLYVNWHQKQDIHHTLLRDLRNLHTVWMMPHPTLTEHSWRSTVQLWYGSHVSRQMLPCLVLNQVARADLGPKEVHTVEDLGNISMNPRVRTEVHAVYEKMLNPITESPATGKSVTGIDNLFVDDLFGTVGTEMEQRVLIRFKKDFQVVSGDWNDVSFTGQRIRWTKISQLGSCTPKSEDRR